MFKKDYTNMMQHVELNQEVQKQLLDEIYHQAEVHSAAVKKAHFTGNSDEHRGILRLCMEKICIWNRKYRKFEIAGLCIAIALVVFFMNPMDTVFHFQNNTEVNITSHHNGFAVYAGEKKIDSQGVRVTLFDIGNNAADAITTATCRIDGAEAKYLVYAANINVQADEKQEIDTIAYTFAQGSGGIGTRIAWPDELQEFYEDGHPYDDASRKKQNLFRKSFEQYCEKNNTIQQRFKDNDTNLYYMIQYHDNPYQIAFKEQPEQLYFFVRLKNVQDKKKSDLEIIQDLRKQIENTRFTISVAYADGTNEEQTYGMKVEYQNTLVYMDIYEME